jgi:HPt (histidine-containing phosphotransfer) domain-containing protein
MTAYSMQGDKEKFVEAGLDDYVSKPIRPRVLISKLAEILSQESKTGETRNEDQREEVINFEVLKDLEKYGGKELIIDTLNDFREEAAVLIKNCSESKEVQDYDDILSKLHTLKGNASTLGLDRLAGMAKSIEARLKEGDTIALEQDLQKLQQCFSEFLQEFNSFLNSNTHG